MHQTISESGRNIHDATSVLGWHVWNLEKGVCAMFRFQTKVLCTLPTNLDLILLPFLDLQRSQIKTRIRYNHDYLPNRRDSITPARVLP